MTYFNVVIRQLAQLVTYAIIGIIAAKAGVFDRKALENLAKLLTKILLPMLVFTNTINGCTRQEFVAALPLLLATVLFYVITWAFGYGSSRMFRLQGNERKIYHACAMFGNNGFIGIPIILALFPDSGMLYIALFTIPDQFALWTIGMDLSLPVDTKEGFTVKQRIRKMINPCSVAVLLSVFLVLTGIQLPELLGTALTKVGSAATPLAMIYLGGTLSFISLRECLRRKEFYGFVVLKMICLPVLMFFVMRVFPGLTTDMVVTLAVLCGMPSMTSVTMMAQTNGSASDYSAGVILMSTVGCIVTLPLICFIIGHLV